MSISGPLIAALSPAIKNKSTSFSFKKTFFMGFLVLQKTEIRKYHESSYRIKEMLRKASFGMAHFFKKIFVKARLFR